MSIDAIYERAGWGNPVTRGSRPGLVAVDYTNGFSRVEYPTGADLSQQIARTNEIAAAVRRVGAPVIWTRIAYSEAEVQPGVLAWLTKAQGMRLLLEGSEAAALDSRCEFAANDQIVTKKGASAFHGTNLQALLVSQQVDTLIVCGATTSGCVRATVVDAVQSGFSVLVVANAVGDRAHEPHRANLFDMHAKYADVVDSENVLTWLDGIRPDRNVGSEYA